MAALGAMWKHSGKIWSAVPVPQTPTSVLNYFKQLLSCRSVSYFTVVIAIQCIHTTNCALFLFFFSFPKPRRVSDWRRALWACKIWVSFTTSHWKTVKGPWWYRVPVIWPILRLCRRRWISSGCHFPNCNSDEWWQTNKRVRPAISSSPPYRWAFLRRSHRNLKAKTSWSSFFLAEPDRNAQIGSIKLAILRIDKPVRFGNGFLTSSIKELYGSDALHLCVVYWNRNKSTSCKSATNLCPEDSTLATWRWRVRSIWFAFWCPRTRPISSRMRKYETIRGCRGTLMFFSSQFFKFH